MCGHGTEDVPGGRGSVSKGLMVSRRGVCPQQPLCAPPPETLDGAGTPNLVEGLAYVFAPQARVKVSSSRDGE